MTHNEIKSLIEELGLTLHLTKDIVDGAVEESEKNAADYWHNNRDKYKIIYAAAFLLRSVRRSNYPLSLSEVAISIRVTRKELSQVNKVLNKSCGDVFSIIKAEDFVHRFYAEGIIPKNIHDIAITTLRTTAIDTSEPQLVIALGVIFAAGCPATLLAKRFGVSVLSIYKIPRKYNIRKEV